MSGLFYSIPRNSIRQSSVKTGTDFDLNRFWRNMADLYNVPYFNDPDDRVLKDKQAFPVRFDLPGEGLQFFNGNTKQWEAITGSGVYGAENGLTMAAFVSRLGGPLTQNTLINIGSAYQFSLTSNTVTDEASFEQSGGSITAIAEETSTGNRSQVVLNKTNLTCTGIGTQLTSIFTVGQSGVKLVQSGTGKTGIIYEDDNQLDWTNKTLVTKEYVDALAMAAASLQEVTDVGASTTNVITAAGAIINTASGLILESDGLNNGVSRTLTFKGHGATGNAQSGLIQLDASGGLNGEKLQLNAGGVNVTIGLDGLASGNGRFASYSANGLIFSNHNISQGFYLYNNYNQTSGDIFRVRNNVGGTPVSLMSMTFDGKLVLNNLSAEASPSSILSIDPTTKEVKVSPFPTVVMTGNAFTASSQAEQEGLAAVVGDIVVRNDENKTYILQSLPASTFSNWLQLLFPGAPVTSFNTRTGAIMPASGDYTFSQITSTPTTLVGYGITDAASKRFDIEAIAGPSHILELVDEGRLLENNSSLASVFIIPANADVAFEIGTIINIVQKGTGQITVIPDTGVAMLSAQGANKTAYQYSMITLIKRDTNEWYLTGDITV